MWTLYFIFPESQSARTDLSGQVAEDLKRVIERELQDEVDARPDGQSNVSRQALMLCNHCS